MNKSLLHRAWRGAAGFAFSFSGRACFNADHQDSCGPLRSGKSSLAALCVVTIVAIISPQAVAQNAPAKPAESTAAKASPTIRLEELKLLALGPNEGRAVFQFPDHSMQVVRSGEPIPGLHATLVDVQEDKAVIEELVQPEHGKQGVQKQTVWMSKSQGSAAGRIQRFAYNGEQPVSERAPTAVIVPLSGPATKAPAGSPKNSN